MGTKEGSIYGKGAPFMRAPQTLGEAVALNCPPDAPLDISHILKTRYICNYLTVAFQLFIF